MKPPTSARQAETKGAQAGMRFANKLNLRIADGASILFDPWRDALTEAKIGVRKLDRLADKIAFEHCFMATFRENFSIKPEPRGKADYEADCTKTPNYHDGAPRKSWNQLGEVEQWSWNRGQIS